MLLKLVEFWVVVIHIFVFVQGKGGDGGEGVVRPKAIQAPDGIMVCGYYPFFLFMFRAC